ncbi:MBL fold metallo-hydrolase [Aerococcus suis]|uniref:Phosphoribosyl 1,2-cyclic phosphodiesterase n=1 Tax=Aerococcus suis TaxID=371602 RepID=A0A1W1Y4E4_9LACT|nr:MBL fold metallo-hydrolase [Aerococcus suis]MCI7240061.1 MBL fold metallo-hydrolase [Aerococcus suis]MDD7758324.1 MBL fold metallo-hydrolase [Aerococcus suis]MDY4646301.1 MBL fold metallo-hydrolase [Aerococcus suis]SMC31025.1 Phosphoribosyl 1,2-cyclic phosphodiesterase [Aerococcus suis]
METSDNDFTMRVSMLSSSSKGNSTYIETPKRKILVDAGFSGKQMQQKLAKIGRDIRDVDSIFVTHEHSDHIKGLGVLARKYDVNLYANEDTWQAIGQKCGVIDPLQKNVIERGERLTLGDIDIQSFGVSHDAADPQFYAFQKDGRQFTILTDTGYVSDKLRGLLRNSDVFLIESNHDLDMLRMGRYPWSLKQRILGDKGHLSNDSSALAMSEMIGDRTKRVYLGHLSEENNLKSLAYQTNATLLSEQGLGVNETFELKNTDPHEPTDLFEL